MLNSTHIAFTPPRYGAVLRCQMLGLCRDLFEAACLVPFLVAIGLAAAWMGGRL